MATTFDLFGTLVTVDRPDDPAVAVGRELAARDVEVPDDWTEAYEKRHVDAPAGAEVPLPSHVAAALASRDVAATGNAIRRAVVAAFDPAVTTRPGAVAAVEVAAERGPVGVLSNCSVPELASRALVRSTVDRDALDVTVTSAGCGWRKPDPRAFEAVARRLGVDPDEVVHVGDDPTTDGGIEDVGGRAVLLDDVPLESVPEHLPGGSA